MAYIRDKNEFDFAPHPVINDRREAGWRRRIRNGAQPSARMRFNVYKTLDAAYECSADDTYDNCAELLSLGGYGWKTL